MRGLRTFFNLTSWWGFTRAYARFASRSYGRHGGWAMLEDRPPVISRAFLARVAAGMEASRSGSASTGVVPPFVARREYRPLEAVSVGGAPSGGALVGETLKELPTRVKTPSVSFSRSNNSQSQSWTHRGLRPAAVSSHGGLRGGAAGKWSRRQAGR